MGETQEVKFVDIDELVPIEAPEAANPFPFAEIDANLFDDDPIVAKFPTSSSAAPATDSEFASPIFMKRSRASYGPLFDLEELEEDSGRSSKRRKGLRYSAVNGRWRVHEGSKSPSPEPVVDSPVSTQDQHGDVEMQNTPEKPEMTDDGVQTQEFDLAPLPSSPVDTPSKSWNRPETSLSSGAGFSRTPDNTRPGATVQESSPQTLVPATADVRGASATRAAPNPFGQAFKPAAFNTLGQATPVFGAPAENRESTTTQTAPSPFGNASLSSGFAGFGQNQGFWPTPSTLGPAPSAATNAGLGQNSSLFGNVAAQSQSIFPHAVSSSTGFGAPSGSVRFGFGQEPHSSFGTSSHGTGQETTQNFVDPYPESSLVQSDAIDYSNTSHNPFDTTASSSFYGHDPQVPVEQQAPGTQMLGQEVPLWPVGTQFDSTHAAGHMNAAAAEDLRSDGRTPHQTPPGMIPPAVDDGTRNRDEMRQEGILSRPVYGQDVPREALAGQEYASAVEDGEPMDSEERADYDEAEKGADYDLRNYEGVSDDEEGHEYEDGPLSDEELLEEAPEHWPGPAHGYAASDYAYGRGQEDEDEDEYDYDDEDEEEEDSESVPQPPRLPQPSVQQEKIVIDLLSDSDDDDPPPPPVQPPRYQTAQQQPIGLPVPPEDVALSKNESESEDDEDDEDDDAPALPHPPMLGNRPERIDVDEEPRSSDQEREQLSEDGVDSADEESESDDKIARGSPLLMQPAVEMSESSSHEENEEENDETQVQEAIAVSPAQSQWAHAPIDVDEDRRSPLEESGSDVEDKGEASNTSIVHNTQLDDAHNAMIVDENQPDQMAHSNDTQEDQAEAQIVDVVDQRPLDGADNAAVVNDVQPIDSATSEGGQEDKAKVRDAVEVHGSQLAAMEDFMVVDERQQTEAAEGEGNQEDRPDVQHAVAATSPTLDIAEDAMAVDEGSLDNPAPSFQSQPENMLHSFQSNLTAPTNLSSASQASEAEDVEMKEDIAQEPQSSVPESVATGQELQKDWSEQPSAGVEQSQGTSEDDSMDIEAPDITVVEFKKTFTVEVSVDDDDEIQPLSSPVLQQYTQLSDQPPLTLENNGMESPHPVTEDETDRQRDALDTQEPVPTASLQNNENRESDTEARDGDMADSAVASQAEDDTQESGVPQEPLNHDMGAVDEAPDLAPSEVEQEAPEDEENSLPPTLDDVNAMIDQAANEKQRLFAQNQDTNSDGGEEFHDASEMPAQTASSPAARREDSFASVASHISDTQDAEETEMVPLENPKRGGKKTRTVSAKSTSSAKSTISARKGPRQASRQSSRQLSSQEAPSSRRTTRSKTMSFRTTSPKDNREDMSIKMARAAMKSPTSKKRKVSATTAKSTSSTKRAPVDMAKRLETAFSNALPLKDLRKFHNPQPGRHPPDFAAVVTSASSPPKRTEIREYRSVFTVTDPSIASDGVIQVEMFNKRSEFFPAVEAGDSILLRNFMAVSLRDRGFGLTSRSATGSSWAVFKAGGSGEPEMKAPVEMTAKERKFMLDLRSWYADLDDAAKGKLGEGAGAVTENPKESQANK